ncbi:hypothetical protein BJ165DRAFT_1468853, partial [Panaeolus papilionaceus]
MIIYRNALYPSSVNTAWDDPPADTKSRQPSLPVYSPMPTSLPTQAMLSNFNPYTETHDFFHPESHHEKEESCLSLPISPSPPPGCEQKKKRRVLRELGRGTLLVVCAPVAMAGMALYATGIIIEGTGLALKSVGHRGAKLFREPSKRSDSDNR